MRSASSGHGVTITATATVAPLRATRSAASAGSTRRGLAPLITKPSQSAPAASAARASSSRVIPHTFTIVR